MFASPRTPTTAATPTSGRQSEGEGTAWEKAAEWSRNILDISRPFALTADDKASSPATPGTLSHRDQHAGSLEASLDQGLDIGKEHERSNLHQVGPGSQSLLSNLFLQHLKSSGIGEKIKHFL